MKYTLVLLSLVISVGYAAEQKQYQTTAGDSLSNILRSQNYGQTYADIKPYFAEVIKLNPHAFKDGNPNQMIPGAVLTLPANPNAIETAPDSAPELVATPEPEPAAEPEPEPGSEAESETGPAAETEASIVGSIEVTRGFSEIIRDSEIVTVTRRENLFATDEIFTQQNTRAEIRFADETMIGLGPESRFEINEFAYSGNQALDAASRDSLIATLHRGRVHIITGRVAQGENNRVEFQSALMTSISIRGTEFTVRACIELAHCGDLFGVSAAVKAGSISLKNATTEITLDKDEFGRVQNATDAPVKAVLPEGFHDLDFKAGKIEASSSWWQKAIDWFSAYF